MLGLVFILLSCQPAAHQRQAVPAAVTVTPLIQNEYLDSERDWFAAFTRSTGIQVRVVPTLESSTDRLGQFRKFLNAHSTEPDVLTLDVIWPALFADALVDLKPLVKGDLSAQMPELLRNSTVGGRLVAMPVTFDVGMLYYRLDLLNHYGFESPPRTWAELEHMASVIQSGERRKGNRNFWGYVWQGAPYEGLTCNALEWQVANNGGRILDDTGAVTVNNPGVIAALNRAARWVGSISPRSVLGYREEDARNIWEAGNAAFMRNWQYAYRLGMKAGALVRGQMRVAPLPAGGTIGGAALAMSRYSKHKDEALAFIRYFTSLPSQEERWRTMAGVPTIAAVYQATDLDHPTRAAMPMQNVILNASFARPSTIAAGRYDQVSRAYFTTVHAVLSGEVSARDGLVRLERELTDITGLVPASHPDQR